MMATIIGSGLEVYLHRQAREQALNHIAEAQEQARKIIEQANVEIAAVQQGAEARTNQAVGEQRRRAQAQARLRAKQTHVRRQEEFIQRLWTEAEAHLKALSEPGERLAILTRLLADAARQLGGGALELQTNAADRTLFAGRVLDEMAQNLYAQGVTQLTLADAAAPILGGVIVRRTDVRQLVDNSFDERLALAKRTLRESVFRVLMPQ
jgi:vacuolar-type H+-ATPase subunit E/Vma4